MNDLMPPVNFVNTVTLDINVDSLGLITSENNLLKVLRCSGNTFHRLFQHSTHPQLEKLKNFINGFNKLQRLINLELKWLYGDILYLTVTGYEVFLYLAYLLTSILRFNDTQASYIKGVKEGLLGLMSRIKVMLMSSSTFLHALMNILILHFCVMINGIFGIIKAKLLFYLKLVELQIYADYLIILIYIESYNKRLFELELDLSKYIPILVKVKELFKKHEILLTPSRIFTTSLSMIQSLYKIFTKISPSITSVCYLCNILPSILFPGNDNFQSVFVKLDSKSKNIIVNVHSKRQTEVTASITNIDASKIRDFQKSAKTIKNILEKIPKVDLDVSKEIDPIIKKFLIAEMISDPKGVSVTPFTFHSKLILQFNKSLESIKKLLKMMENVDIVVSGGIMSIILQLNVLETINLKKLFELIKEIQNLYLKILVRGNLLKCTIQFYEKIQQAITRLIGLMQFDCSKPSEFLGKCSTVEQISESISDEIDNCIIKLREACRDSKCLGVPKELLKLYSTIIEIVGWLKFYVDLMVMEILIFRNIITNLIFMASSSFLIDGIILYIARITDINSAINTLRECHGYLNTFYLIQLENTLIIVGLSSALKFSQSIHGYYHVLLYNLQLINGLIWVIECYIHHLMVFKFTSLGLNSISTDIAKQLQIITNIYKVISSLATISNKLKSIDKSMKELNKIQEELDITNWKQSAQSIRDQTQSVSKDILQINTEIKEIGGHLVSISKSLVTLVWLYYFLLGLIEQIRKEIQNTNKSKIFGTGTKGPNSSVLIMSAMEPCNRQIKFILLYLNDISVFMRSLIKIVENTIEVIIVEMGWLNVLTSKLQTNIDEINKGAVDMECAIEGVARKN